MLCVYDLQISAYSSTMRSLLALPRCVAPLVAILGENTNNTHGSVVDFQQHQDTGRFRQRYLSPEDAPRFMTT